MLNKSSTFPDSESESKSMARVTTRDPTPKLAFVRDARQKSLVRL